MKWLLILLILISAYMAAAHFSGGAFYSFGLPLGGDCGMVRKISNQFWEDIQFKDFNKAASYHAKELRNTVDIPFLLERLFVQKPEALDIMEIDIVFCKLDSSNKRARVKNRLKVKDLVKQEIRDQEVMLYFQRQAVNQAWYMELESSLRQLQGDKNKKH